MDINEEPRLNEFPVQNRKEKAVKLSLGIIGVLLLLVTALVKSRSYPSAPVPHAIGAFVGASVMTSALAGFIALVRTQIMKRENSWFWTSFVVIALLYLLSSAV